VAERGWESASEIAVAYVDRLKIVNAIGNPSGDCGRDNVIDGVIVNGEAFDA
jgi:hypothetical protein